MKLMVIDGNSILNRAYYGIRPLTTRDGLYTTPSSDFSPRSFDWRGRRHRTRCASPSTSTLQPSAIRRRSLQGHPQAMPEELRVQVPVLKEVLDA